MDMAWAYYLQKKLEVQSKKENTELVEKNNEKQSITLKYCSVCGQQLYFCMCSKNVGKMNSKNLEIHIDDS